MTDKKITQLASLPAALVDAAVDLLGIVDVSDTSMNSTGTDKSITPAALGDALPALTKTAKIGAMTVLSHSYGAGSTQNDSGVANVYQESVIAKLQALLDIHDSNVRHFGQAASRLTANLNALSGSPFAGWATALQFFMPNSSVNVNASADVVILDQNVAAGGLLAIVHGINDLTADNVNVSAATTAQMLSAWKHALRTVVSRYRAGLLFCSTAPTGTISWDSSIVFNGTWADAATAIGNTGPAVKRSRINGDYVEITLPTNFTGGTVAVCFISPQNGYTTLSGSMTNVTTSMPVTSAAQFPISALGTYVAHIAAEGGNTAEDVLITAGQGTTTWTVTRGVNGTTASAHGAGAAVTIQNTGLVTWSTNGANGAISGTTSVSGQGYAGSQGPVIKRFACTSADAGKTIRATISGVVTNNTGSDGLIAFDSWWVESNDPPPILIPYVQYWEFGVWFRTWAQWQADIVSFNAATDAVIAEFDGWVKAVDTYMPFFNRAGLITGAMNNTDVTTSIGWTANSSSFTPTVGMRMTFGNTNFGGSQELCDVIGVSGSAPNWTLNLQRGVNGTSKLTHASGDFMSSNEWMHVDEIHLSIKGHSVFAQLMYAALATMPVPSQYQLAQIQGAWSQTSQSPLAMGLIDNQWLSPTITNWAGTAVAQNTEGAMPIYIPRDCIVTGFAVVVSVGTAATIRGGIYFPDKTHSRPGRLLVGFGTQVDSGKTAPWVSSHAGVYAVLRPGWYWLGAVQQATAVTLRCCGAAGLAFPSLSSAAVPTVATANVCGYSRTGMSGALTDWSSWTEESGASPNLPIVWLRLRSVNFG